MIGTLDIKVNAAHPNMPLSPVYTFLGSPQQVRIINVPKAIGNWKITAVQITVNYPDNSSPSVEATLTGGCWHGTLPAPSATGKSLMGFKITASGVDERNDPITGYVLGKGDAYVLDDDATITVGGTTYYVHLVDTTPEAPHKGDLDLSTMKLWNGSAWVSLGADITLDDTVTETSANGVKSSGIWSFVKGLLPSWLTSNYTEPATVASVNAKYTKPSDGIPLSDLKPSAFPPEAHTHAQSEVTGLTAALAGKLNLTGGTITGDLKNGDVTWNNRTITYRDSYGRTGSISLPALTSSITGSYFATKKQIDDAVSGKADKSDFTIGSFADYVASLFSIDNSANDAANINYTATGETATTVKAKIQSIENLVGTANADLEDALNGTEVA